MFLRLIILEMTVCVANENMKVKAVRRNAGGSSDQVHFSVAQTLQIQEKPRTQNLNKQGLHNH